MIGVICNSERTYKDFINSLEFSKKENYSMINKIDHIRGVWFESLIYLYDYKRIRHYEELIHYTKLRTNQC